jgi:hypothetical protein
VIYLPSACAFIQLGQLYYLILPGLTSGLFLGVTETASVTGRGCVAKIFFCQGPWYATSVAKKTP